jgi:hypothetical protein
MGSDPAAHSNDNKAADLVQAILELIRQGYLDTAHGGSADGASERRRSHELPQTISVACMNFLEEHRTTEAWEAYLEELDQMTCLDVLPQNEDDLEPYRRSA